MNIKRIIQEERVEIYFQPIMSTHNSRFLGFESLVRGLNANGGTIPPDLLFKQAISENQVLELDKLCIRKGLLEGAKLLEEDDNVILFLNIDASVIDYYIHSSYILDLVDEINIQPESIVLEINELPVDSLEIMKKFSRLYKEAGFMIAIDDIGGGASNLDRIPMIMPDIMKVDKELIRGIEKSFYKTQVVSMIIQLATNLGALVVVEGIEDIKELRVISENGAHLIQGYLLGRPVDRPSIEVNKIKDRIKHIISQLHYDSMIASKDQSRTHQWMNSLCDHLIGFIRNGQMEFLDEHLPNYMRVVDNEDACESVYVIDKEGTMVTSTIFNTSIHRNKNKKLFKPCIKGDSVRLEVYYTKIMDEAYSFWVSKEYISRASGNKCMTLSKKFNDKKGTPYIVCMDFHMKNLSRSLAMMKMTS